MILKDSDWVIKSFLGIEQIPGQKLASDAVSARVFTDARYKFTDTSLGGNFSLNNPPSSNPLADPVIKGRIPGSTMSMSGSKGMGLKFSEHIDDHSELLYLRCGHLSYTGLTTFFNEFYNYEASVMARTGRTPGFMYSLGKALGFVTMIPFMPYLLLGKISKMAFDSISGGNKSSKFATLKPNMYGYWGSVAWVYNAIGVNMNLVWPYAPENLTAIESATRDKLISQYPDLIDDSGLVDIFRVALRGQRLANDYRESVRNLVESSDDLETFRNNIRAIANVDVDYANRDMAYSQYLATYQKLDGTMQTGDPAVDDNTNMNDDTQSWFGEFTDNLQAGLNDGADWLVLRVKHKKDWTINFSNSTQENPLVDKFNSISEQSRSTSSMFAGGNLGDGAIASAIEGVIGGVKDVVAGAASTYGVAGFAALGGTGLVDIQKIHGDSSFSLPGTSYTVELDTPGGDKWSEYLHIMPTVCALLATTLPISTGKHSYTSPYYVEAYQKGKLQIREGIIGDLTITRGRNNVGWTHDDRARGYTIDFTILDLTSVMHMPMNPMSNIWDGNNAFSDLLAVMSSLDIYQQLYAIPRLNLKLAGMKANIEQSFTPAKLGLSLADSMVGRTARNILRGTDSLKN